MIEEEIRERITEGLKISRIPPKTREWYVAEANEEFCGDYGMLLKHLVDFYVGLIPSGIEHIEAELGSLKERIGRLEASLSEQKVKAKSRLDGTGGKQDE